jgi:hypothetical protein
VTLNPIFLTGIFFFGSLILVFCYFGVDEFIRNAFKQYWKIIVILILVNIVIKIPYKSNYFDGLEYEDSYIYKASARAIYEGDYGLSKINPYYPTSCIYGSLKDCRMSGIFVTNFMGYPYLINLGYRLFGYQINISNIVSLIFSGVSIAFIFLAALLMIDRLLSAIICSFVYLTIPIFNVYASTSLTEPLSNACLIMVLLLYLMFWNTAQEGKRSLLKNVLGLSAITFTLIFSILVKTINISLVFCLPIASLISLIVEKKTKDRKQKNKLLISLPVMFSVFLFSALLLKFQTGLEINRGDIGVNPFSFSYFKALAPIFAASFFNFQWYLVYTLFFLGGIVFGLKKKKGIFTILTFVFYFVLYTLHYRSYYFTRGIAATMDEALRYMTSIISVYALIAGLGIYALWQLIKTSKLIKTYAFAGKSILSALAIFTLAAAIVFTFKARTYFVEDEHNVRIAPVLKTLEYLKNKDSVIITSEHILFQIYGNPDLFLIDFSSIENQVSREKVDEFIQNKDVYYLETMDRTRVGEERYQRQYKYIDSKPKECIFSSNTFRLYRIFGE